MRGVRAEAARCCLILLIIITGPRIIWGRQPAPHTTSESPPVKVSVFSLDSGAELLTLSYSQSQTGQDIPILSLLRDTLGDSDQENDVLRYVWIYTYAPPTLLQHVAASIPFLYHRITTRREADDVPPVVIDLSKPETRTWRKVIRWALQNTLLDPRGWAFRTLPRANQKNLEEYRNAQIVKALAILTLYERGSDSLLRTDEIDSMKSYLTGENLVASLVRVQLQSQIAAKEEHKRREQRATNWDLLRQRAEEEGLYFEPIGMPNEPPTHALLWIAKDDLRQADKYRRFNPKFLNIRNPWTDQKLLQWTGYTKTIHLDQENRPWPEAHATTREKELIPLAVYGLDFPKIPILLVDVRHTLNPKQREASGRAMNDAARYLANMSPSSDLKYFLTRSLLNFVTRKKGMDVNQPSRFKSYAELDALLLTSDKIHPDLKALLGHKAETSQVLPVENSFKRLPDIARQQHDALLRQAVSTDGEIARRLAHDRDHEVERLTHGKLARLLLKLAHLGSLGLYHHHETMTPELARRYEISRRFAYHQRRLETAVSDSLRLDHEQNMPALRASLQFFQEHGEFVEPEMAGLLKRAFYKSDDTDFRAQCLRTLARLTDKGSKRVLASIYHDPRVSSELREISKTYLSTGSAGGRETHSIQVPQQ